MKRRFSIVLGAIAWWLVSCREIPAPEGGVLSLSPIALPSPGLVVGDTMRDSTGLVAPLSVTAYGLDGEPLSPQPTATFVVLDTGAHLAGPLLIGDNTGTTVRVVGTVGALQTQFASVKVTASPDTIVAADSILHRKAYSIIAGDTVAVSAELSVLVQNLAATAGVEAVIVRYVIDQAPTGNGSGPTVVLANGNQRSSRDTTDTGGRAARTARLRIAALSPPFDVDTVVVSASAAYRGVSLGTIVFTIIFTNQP